MAAGRGDPRLALGAELWGRWESVGFRGLAFLGLMGVLHSRSSWVGGGKVTPGVSGEQSTLIMDLSIFNLAELLITGCLILYCKQLDALGPGKLTEGWGCRGDHLLEEEAPQQQDWQRPAITHGGTKESGGRAVCGGSSTNS